VNDRERKNIVYSENIFSNWYDNRQGGTL